MTVDSHWFGPLKKFLIDNGSEFNNENHRELVEQFNVEVCATAAYSSWSNIISKRNHYIIEVCMQKMMMEDPKMLLLHGQSIVCKIILDIAQFVLCYATTPIYYHLW